MTNRRIAENDVCVCGHQAIRHRSETRCGGDCKCRWFRFERTWIEHQLLALRATCVTADDQVRFDELFDGTCHRGDCANAGIVGRRRTSYNVELSNWTSLCEECWQDDNAYWDERWDEYRQMVMP